MRHQREAPEPSLDWSGEVSPNVDWEGFLNRRGWDGGSPVEGNVDGGEAHPEMSGGVLGP